jgi:hypothetical protein
VNVNVNDFFQVFGRIKKDEKTKQRFYVDDIRCHKTDGIIFTPDEAYHPKTTNNLFKWKYIDKLSLDFKVAMTHNSDEFILIAQGDGTEVECKSVMFLEDDKKQLLNDISAYPNLKNYIIECTYDPWSGYWRYQGIRSKSLSLIHNTQHTTHTYSSIPVSLLFIFLNLNRESTIECCLFIFQFSIPSL